MKTAHLTWEEVQEAEKGEQVTVYYHGTHLTANADNWNMNKMFEGCELMRMAKHVYMVTRWPEDDR